MYKYIPQNNLLVKRLQQSLHDLQQNLDSYNRL